MIIENGTNIKDGFSLLKYDDFIGIGNVTFPKKDNTIEELMNWENECNEVIPLNNLGHTCPQEMCNHDLDDTFSISFIIERALEDYNKDNETNYDKGDICVPFIGGIQRFNFQDFMNKLWNINSNNLWEYRDVAGEYFYELIGEIVG